MRTPLAVNPDGTAGSYVPGDHGFTYIVNGVNLIRNGQRVPCLANQSLCRREWEAAEKGAFGPGTPEFCVFAMEVEPMTPGGMRVECERKRGRYVVGNGKGRPRLGEPIPTATGGTVAPYVSTTALRHMRDGAPAYVDSALVPGLVVPESSAALLGAIAWVRHGDREVFAIVSDTGPRYGEGSIALHRLLQGGALHPLQAVGPIPAAQRCSRVETGLRPPFSSKPDPGGDACRPRGTGTGAADIRAYDGIRDGVISVILPSVTAPMRHRTVTEEITPDRLRAWAVSQGYTPERLRRMADCLGR